MEQRGQYLACSCSYWKWWYLLPLLVILDSVPVDADTHNGVIVLKYGEPLDILCVLDPSFMSQGFNSSHLVFYHTNFQVGRVKSDFVTLINESTARLYIEQPEPMVDMFCCTLDNRTSPLLLSDYHVTVGYSPQEVLNFSCVSYNWINLNCTWVPPVNYVETVYTLIYYLPGRAGGRLKYPCPYETDVTGKNYCFWDQDSPTPYREPYEYYYFVMTGKNRFGTHTAKIKFHHYANVIPAKPVNLTVVEKTSSSALLQWSLQSPMHNFPPGVIHRVEYISACEPRDSWHPVDTSSLNKKNATHRLNVTGLEFCNTFYKFRVFMRSAVAIGEAMWSEPATITIKTSPCDLVNMERFCIRATTQFTFTVVGPLDLQTIEEESSSQTATGVSVNVLLNTSQKLLYSKALEGNILKEDEDEFDLFGRSVAAQLRKMDGRQNIISENIINQVLFLGKLNKLQDNTKSILHTILNSGS